MGGIWSFSTGNPRLSNMLMRARVAVQGATLAAVLYGTYDQMVPKKAEARTEA